MQNLEIKARYPDLRAARHRAEQLGAAPAGRLVHVDTYYHVRHGRLKLRRIRDGAGEEQYELIHYQRPDRAGPRTSDYERVPLPDGRSLGAVLAAALGVRTRVHKTREVFLKDNLRIHLDRVRGLGAFLEFELIVSPDHPPADCRRQMDGLLALFAIGPADLVAGSYADLVG